MKKSDWLDIAIITASIITAFITLVFITYTFLKFELDSYGTSNDLSATGQLGDFFGGIVGSILTFISILILIKANINQREDFKLQLDLITIDKKLNLLKTESDLVEKELNKLQKNTTDRLINVLNQYNYSTPERNIHLELSEDVKEEIDYLLNVTKALIKMMSLVNIYFQSKKYTSEINLLIKNALFHDNQLQNYSDKILEVSESLSTTDLQKLFKSNHFKSLINKIKANNLNTNEINRLKSLKSLKQLKKETKNYMELYSKVDINL
ncbi:hypothetical protein [Jiulongibacter sp. NS-SX5]|uniref:hypothetical protein n=1 Tax=Jiulongibacter sp. NS-SX5 TaxID=3463854 RepID=UPI0040580F8A